MSPPPVLSFKNASRFFYAREGMFGPLKTVRAVNDVSFNLAAGESLGLVGESGCGKSTLGKLACGLLPLSSGEILFRNNPLPPANAKSGAAGRLQMIFQDPASSLNPRLKILSSVAEPLRARGVSRRESLLEAEKALELVGLGGSGNRYPHQFSGGQKQRVAAARALITRPDAVVCDEPVSALDASVQAQILNLLSDMREKFNPAYLFISHDLAVVGFACSRVLVMYLGEIVEEAPRENLFAGPAHPYSRALMAAMPGGEREWSGGGLRKLPPPLPGEPPSPLNPPKGCYFHPRCPMAKDICELETPPWKELGANWRARCHFAGRLN